MFDSSRILVIDDDELIVWAIRDILSYEYAVDTACDAPNGLSLIRHNQYDLLILDLGLPQTSGVELVRMLRTDPFTRYLPILLISAFPELKKMVSAETVSGFLPKPFLVPELVRMVKDIIARPGRRFPEDILRDLDGGLLEPALLLDWSTRLRRSVQITRQRLMVELDRNRELKERHKLLAYVAQELMRYYDRRVGNKDSR